MFLINEQKLQHVTSNGLVQVQDLQPDRDLMAFSHWTRCSGLTCPGVSVRLRSAVKHPGEQVQQVNRFNR